MSETILSIENLRIHFETFAGEVQAIRGVNLKLQKAKHSLLSVNPVQEKV